MGTGAPIGDVIVIALLMHFPFNCNHGSFVRRFDSSIACDYEDSFKNSVTVDGFSDGMFAVCDIHKKNGNDDW